MIFVNCVIFSLYSVIMYAILTYETYSCLFSTVSCYYQYLSGFLLAYYRFFMYNVILWNIVNCIYLKCTGGVRRWAWCMMQHVVTKIASFQTRYDTSRRKVWRVCKNKNDVGHIRIELVGNFHLPKWTSESMYKSPTFRLRTLVSSQ